MKKKIDRKPPTVGLIIKRKFKNKIHTMRVVETEEGIGYEVDGEVFNSPSSAARKITVHPVNGWRFWHLD